MTKNKTQNKTHRINYNIKSRLCNVIMPDGSGIKQMQTIDAIELARSQNLDLIEVGFDKSKNIPVCKIINYGKLLYQQAKNEKEQKQKNRQHDVKTIQFGLMTDDNDKNRLISKVKELVSKGDNVKVSIRFKNRSESNNVNYLKITVDDILTKLSDVAEMLPGSKANKTFRDYSFVVSKKKI